MYLNAQFYIYSYYTDPVVLEVRLFGDTSVLQENKRDAVFYKGLNGVEAFTVNG